MTITRAASYFISTPIYYVNSKPHIGHLYSSLLADAIARWQLVKYRSPPQIIFSTGTDEHGLKIERAATATQLTPLEFCNQISENFRRMFDRFSINYTNYIRTSDKSHSETVEYVWKQLFKENLIYKGSYEGWYSVPDECFVSEDEIIEDSSGQAKIKESGRLVEWTEEKNYMFKLSEFHERIEQWIHEKKPLYPVKYNKLALIQLNELKKQGGDISISREAKRLSWGIPVPNDPSQIVYVWIDALINYLTVIGYPNEVRHWPPNCQVIGKEILRFHAIYWPALLMGLNLSLPDQLIVHGHWLKDDKKMSKSLGNVIDPFDLDSKLQSDGVRYCLLREDILSQDANFNEYKMKKYLNAELANTLGNLLNRVTSSSINPTQIYPSHAPSSSKTANELIEQCSNLPSRVRTAYDSYEFYHGIIAIMDVLRSCNTYVQHEQPWVLAKSTRDIDQQRLQTLIYLTLECLRISGILLQPIIPNIAKQLLDQLAIQSDRRTFDDCNMLMKQEEKKLNQDRNERISLYQRLPMIEKDT